MGLQGLKALAERFRAVAGDPAAVAKLSQDSRSANPSDNDVVVLCDRVDAAPDAAAITVVLNEYKARTV